MDERAFFTEKPETKQARYQCPKCRRTSEYGVRWVRRTKKDRPPAGANDEDRAKFAKLRDYLLRVEDEVVCKTCGKKFEIPSLHSMMFLDQIEGLPKDVETDEAEQAEAPAKPMDATTRAALPARFTRPTKGWRG